MLKTKKEIKQWLDSHYIQDYQITADHVVHVNGDVDLRSRKLKEIPLQFGHINGNFNCNNNLLTSCKGFPQSMVGDLDCSENRIKSLEGCPENVEDFNCSHNKLTSLIGCPKNCYNDFECHNNKIQNLNGCPEHIGCNFNCSFLPLTDLSGFSCNFGGKFTHVVEKKNRIISNFDSLYKELNNGTSMFYIQVEHAELMAMIRHVELVKELEHIKVSEVKTKKPKV